MTTTVAIHQPNYLPYLGYFDKIDRADIFVFLDSVTYTHNDWRNRNRIKTQQGGRWLTVPVVQKGAVSTPIKDIRIDGSRWRRKHWITMEQSYSKAPHFAPYRDFFKDVYGTDWSLLGDLDEFLVRRISAFMGLDTVMVDASDLGVGGVKSDLLVGICRAVGADRYISGSGADRYLEYEKFKDVGIEVVAQNFICPLYGQPHGRFIPNLSAVDYLFNRGGWRDKT